MPSVYYSKRTLGAWCGMIITMNIQCNNRYILNNGQVKTVIAVGDTTTHLFEPDKPNESNQTFIMRNIQTLQARFLSLQGSLHLTQSDKLVCQKLFHSNVTQEGTQEYTYMSHAVIAMMSGNLSACAYFNKLLRYGVDTQYVANSTIWRYPNQRIRSGFKQISSVSKLSEAVLMHGNSSYYKSNFAIFSLDKVPTNIQNDIPNEAIFTTAQTIKCVYLNVYSTCSEKLCEANIKIDAVPVSQKQIKMQTYLPTSRSSSTGNQYLQNLIDYHLTEISLNTLAGLIGAFETYETSHLIFEKKTHQSGEKFYLLKKPWSDSQQPLPTSNVNNNVTNNANNNINTQMEMDDDEQNQVQQPTINNPPNQNNQNVPSPVIQSRMILSTKLVLPKKRILLQAIGYTVVTDINKFGVTRRVKDKDFFSTQYGLKTSKKHLLDPYLGKNTAQLDKQTLSQFTELGYAHLFQTQPKKPIIELADGSMKVDEEELEENEQKKKDPVKVNVKFTPEMKERIGFFTDIAMKNNIELDVTNQLDTRSSFKQVFLQSYGYHQLCYVPFPVVCIMELFNVNASNAKSELWQMYPNIYMQDELGLQILYTRQLIATYLQLKTASQLSMSDKQKGAEKAKKRIYKREEARKILQPLKSSNQKRKHPYASEHNEAAGDSDDGRDQNGSKYQAQEKSKKRKEQYVYE